MSSSCGMSAMNCDGSQNDCEPKTVRMDGKLYREGGPGQFYGLGEFYEVPSE